MALTTAVFTRALGLVYLIAFLALRVQLLGLFGGHGLLPIAEYLGLVAERLGAERYWLLPTLAWLDASDATLLRLCDADAVVAVFAVNPFPDHPPRHVRAVTWEYHFTAPDDASEAWWRREWRGVYAPPRSRR
ncbi:MAG: lipase maturation factor family protein [Deltaproteobacteria bacterium]|nr:lipase maturation factor family protein [Deltaproteobacteria bacterium]